MVELTNQVVERKETPYVDKILNELLLEEYNKMILERSSEEVFSGDGGGSTRLLLRFLFQNYNKSAKILGTSLCSKILADEECRKKLDIFESPPSIILTNSPSYMSDKIKNYFFNNIESNVQIKETPSYVTQDGEKETDFLILDNIAYFLELSERKVARCSFNNPSGVLNLSKTFDEIYERS